LPYIAPDSFARAEEAVRATDILGFVLCLYEMSYHPERLASFRNFIIAF